MTELSAHLVDAVLPVVPVRQWVLSLPHRLRYRIAWNHELARAVLGVFVRALTGFYRDRARRRRISGGRTGTVTFLQRFGGALNINPHFHCLALDGVFTEGEGGALAFHAAPPPTAAEVAQLLRTVHRRVVRLLERRGLLPAHDEDADAMDPLFDTSPALSSCYAASVGYRTALGERAGRPLRRVGRIGALAQGPANDLPLGPRRARFDGFDLHADVAIPTRDRARLERLCRYVARPAVAQERLGSLPDGTVVLQLKAPWSDGTEEIHFDPLELLEKLAALPRPRINIVLYHGVLAANAKCRSRVVRYGREAADSPISSEATAQDAATAPPPTVTVPSSPQARRRRYRWAELMRRAFGLDVLECARCGGKLVLLACITQPRVIRAILESLSLPTERSIPAPAIVPASLLSLLTGIVQSLGTEWGLFRNYWISAKLLLTTTATLILLGHMPAVSPVYAAPLSGHVSDRPSLGYRTLRQHGPNDRLTPLADGLAPGARTLLAPGVDHFFQHGEREVRTAAIRRLTVEPLDESR